MAQRKPYVFLLGLAVAFLVPLSFYAVTRFLSKDKVTLPGYFRADRVIAPHDTVFHQVGELQVTNQLGEQVRLNRDLPGKIVLVNLFFTHCPTVCPQLTRHVGLLQNAYRRTDMKENDTLIHFVSLTVDPERDSFPALRAYADRFKANHDHWWFGTASRSMIYSYARNELGLIDSDGAGGAEDMMHSQQLVLLDKDRYIRGYYNGLDSLELRRCANDIGWLVLEKKRPRRTN